MANKVVQRQNEEETIEMLNKIKVHYEDFHNVTYTDSAIKACVRLTERYISDRSLPDKAIDAMDEAGSRIHIQNVATPQDIVDKEKELENIKKELAFSRFML